MPLSPPPTEDATDGSLIEYHTRLDRHRRLRHLGDVILGGQDGLVNVLGVILGVAAATGDARIVLAAGLAAALAESVSMAAVAYTAKEAERAHYQSEVARELRHIDRVPEIEREEIRRIFADKGFSGRLLDEVVETITARREVWVAVMMADEHGLAPVPRGRALRSALVVGAASAVGSMIPLAPFLFLPVAPAMGVAIAVAAVALFVAGAYKSLATVGHWLRGGAELAAIGIAAAFAGYFIGRLFQR